MCWMMKMILMLIQTVEAGPAGSKWKVSGTPESRSQQTMAMGRIWAAACSHMAYNLRMVFTFFNG